MKQGLVLGNSHAGMLVTAEVPPELSLDFFAAPGDGPRDFDLLGSVIAARGDALKRALERFGLPMEIDLARYDFLVVTGCGLSIIPLVLMTQGAIPLRAEAPSTGKPWLGTSYGDPGRALISAALYERAALQSLRQSLAIKLLARLCPAFDGPIFLVPQPRPSAAVLSGDGPKTRFGFRRCTSQGDAGYVAGVYDQALRDLTAEFTDVHLLAQQPETISDAICTKTAFMEGARRLVNAEAEFDETDVLHANGDFGTQILQRIQLQFS